MQFNVASESQWRQFHMHAKEAVSVETPRPRSTILNKYSSTENGQRFIPCIQFKRFQWCLQPGKHQSYVGTIWLVGPISISRPIKEQVWGDSVLITPLYDHMIIWSYSNILILIVVHTQNVFVLEWFNNKRVSSWHAGWSHLKLFSKKVIERRVERVVMKPKPKCFCKHSTFLIQILFSFELWSSLIP